MSEPAIIAYIWLLVVLVFVSILTAGLLLPTHVG